jgi:splicing factor 3B subunit 2
LYRYYEGKEFEVKLKTKVPGILSDDLKQALGMVEGVPPPWLLNVQRYGPPPAYPNLKIPGLNAPIPEGASFGYHPGGWGKPPVDENGNPLYGNVFGKSADAEQVEINISKEKWGEFEEVEEGDAFEV